MIGSLILKDNTIWHGESFGAEKSIHGEVVFATGMTGYPESLTDPSYRGQILVLTYPLVGNYGVPEKKFWESGKIQVAGLVVSSYINTPSHYESIMALGEWLKKEGVPALEIKDTRALTLKIREKGCILGKIDVENHRIPRNESRKDAEFFEDPNSRNLVAEVSIKKPKILGAGKKTVLLVDCGVKRNIIRALTKRKVRVFQVPWDFDPDKSKVRFHGVLISNGPGDPKICESAVLNIKKILAKKIPTFGICLGNQILALSAGGDTAKMKFGHRGQNQPVSLVGTKKCFLTTQNHGFEVKKIPTGFRPWFVNLNDGTNEGIIHKTLPFMSVQFHPESCPGPTDTAWLFDEFVKNL